MSGTHAHVAGQEARNFRRSGYQFYSVVLRKVSVLIIFLELLMNDHIHKPKRTLDLEPETGSVQLGLLDFSRHQSSQERKYKWQHSAPNYSIGLS